VEFRLLGPVELWRGDSRVDIGHAKQRGVLAILLMEVGHPVAVHTLVDRVWGHAPPDAAVNVLYGYVARLRRAVAPAGVRLDRRSGGYHLDVDPDHVDVHRFRRLLAEADAVDGPARALPALDAALALWRGTPFAGTSAPWLATARRVLEEQRLSAVVARNDLLLRTDAPNRLVSQLVELVALYPLDERLVGQLMLAMSGAGRPSDALAQYRLVRDRLRREHGTDPGPVLRGIQQRILRAADPAGPPSGVGPGGESRRPQVPRRWTPRRGRGGVL